MKRNHSEWIITHARHSIERIRIEVLETRNCADIKRTNNILNSLVDVSNSLFLLKIYEKIQSWHRPCFQNPDLNHVRQTIELQSRPIMPPNQYQLLGNNYWLNHKQWKWLTSQLLPVAPISSPRFSPAYIRRGWLLPPSRFPHFFRFRRPEIVVTVFRLSLNSATREWPVLIYPALRIPVCRLSLNPYNAIDSLCKYKICKAVKFEQWYFNN